MTTLRGLFWNPVEARLRAPWRVGATLSLVLLATVAVSTVARPLSALDGADSGAWDLVVVSGAFLALSGAVVAVAWLVDRRYTRDLGVAGGGRWVLDALAGAVVGVTMAVAAVAVMVGAGTATLGGPVTGRTAQLTVTGVGPLAATALWALFYAGAATLEEVVVRGYLLVNVAEGLAGRLGRRRAVVAATAFTAGLFGLLHAANPGGTTLGLVNVSLAGVVLGGAYVLTGRLGLAVGVHAAWNVTVGAVFGLPVSGLETSTALFAVSVDGPGTVTGGAFGPEGGLAMLAALVAGAGLVGFWAYLREGALFVQAHIAEPDLRERPDRTRDADTAGEAEA